MGIAPLLGCVVELAFFDPVEEALPLVPVIDEDALSRVIGYPHEHPLASRGDRAAEADEGDFDGSRPAARTLPVLHPDIDAEFFHGGLARRRRLAARGGLAGRRRFAARRGVTARRGLAWRGGLAGLCGHGRPATPQ